MTNEMKKSRRNLFYLHPTTNATCESNIRFNPSVCGLWEDKHRLFWK